MRILVAITIVFIFLIPVNAQFTEIYDNCTHTLILENKTYFKLEISPVYNYSTPVDYSIKRIIYDLVSSSSSNITLGNVTVKYYGINVVEIKNLWSNETLSLEVSLAYRKELVSEVFTLAEGEKVILPKDIGGYPGIYNLTLKIGDMEFELPTLEITG
jgi:hypothetical protein